jgi:hypothetical protein
MYVDPKVLTACMTGVLICRGFPEDEARAYADTITKPSPDKPIMELARELASVFLTLEAHGKLKTDAN